MSGGKHFDREYPGAPQCCVLGQIEDGRVVRAAEHDPSDEDNAAMLDYFERVPPLSGIDEDREELRRVNERLQTAMERRYFLPDESEHVEMRELFYEQTVLEALIGIQRATKEVDEFRAQIDDLDEPDTKDDT